MVPLANRLKKVRDFNLLVKYGQWINGRFLSLKFLPLAGVKNYFPKKEDPTKFAQQLKFAFTVGLKIDKRAVVRNRSRRQMREVVRLLLKDNQLKSGYYAMLTAKKEILGAEYAEIKTDIAKLLVRAGMTL